MTRRAGLLEHAAMAAKTPGALWEQGTETMRTPALPSRDARGKRWLQAKVQQLLTANAVALAPPRFESDPACSWGREPEKSTTLSLRLAGTPEPTARHFSRTMIADCGAGLYCSQHNVILLMRRMLKTMGLLSA